MSVGASPSSVLSMGYGSWGDVTLLPTWGYGIFAEPAQVAMRPLNMTVPGLDSQSMSLPSLTGQAMLIPDLASEALADQPNYGF